MNIRRATIEDAHEACAVLRRSISELCLLDHGGDPKFLARWLSNKTVENVRRWILESHFFVAEEGGALLGCAAMIDSGKITLNYVAPGARFRGVSKALMSRLEATANALGFLSAAWKARKPRCASIAVWVIWRAGRATCCRSPVRRRWCSRKSFPADMPLMARRTADGRNTDC